MSTSTAKRVRHITVRVACAQLRARSVNEASAALRDIVHAVREAKRKGADLVVLPECSYPGYVLLDADPYRRRIPSDLDALRVVSREAAGQAIDVCFGLARRDKDGALRNQAVYIDSQGTVIGTYAKCRLWNFDRHWFARGDALPILGTRFGALGIMICADGRNPEIARTLAAGGAWMILDPTAWVGSGPTHEAVRNVQADYTLRVRAAENGVWIAAADKCGSELGAVHYAGRSQIVTPDGNLAAVADASSPQIITADVRKTKARPMVASLSSQDLATLRAAPRVTRRPLTRVPPRLWLGIYQSAPGQRDDPLALEAIEMQGAAATIRSGASLKAVHRVLGDARDLHSAVFSGSDLLAPEPARAAALRGADLVVWMRPLSSDLILETARTRALENRTYVALCTCVDQGQGACLIGPDGAVIASALVGVPSGFVAVVDTIATRRKEVVPGTQTFADRIPRIYRWLNAHASAKRYTRNAP